MATRRVKFKMQYPTAALLLLAVLFGTLNVSEAGGGSVSNEPEQLTSKPKIQMLQSYSRAMARDPEEEDKTSEIGADGDGNCPVGEKEGVDGCKVHPLAVAYMEEDKDKEGNYDIHAAVSLDEGQTWKRINLSNNVQRTNTYRGRECFSKEEEDHDDDGDHHHSDGTDEAHDGDFLFTFNGDNFKPMIVAKGDKILVAWTSKTCKGGVPGNQGIGDGPYGGDEADTEGTDGHGDPQNKLNISDAEDRYKVKGKQNCVNHGGVYGLEDVAFSCVFAARGKVESDGTIKWTKPERITSGRRDAYQLVAAVAGNEKAWALAWQEDPRGLRIGEAEGPGDGMSGATVNHKTDIWYSYLHGGDFDKFEVDPESNRYNIEEAARFSTPVRVTDNAPCKKELVNGNLEPRGGPYCHDEDDEDDKLCVDWVNDTVYSDKEMLACKTDEGVLLNGDTGASRPNMFLIPDPSVSGGVRVVLAYEESKGLGKGPGDNHAEEEETQEPAEREDWGKNIYYHTFPYAEPDEIAHGTRVNLPELDEKNEPAAVTEDETEFLTLNARRVRMIIQPPKNIGDSNLAMVLLYREGEEGHGHPAHIVMRRFIGGYEATHMECTKTRKHPITNKDVCTEGTTDLNADNTPDPEGEFDDARAHRGFLRGDFLVLGYIYTPKWGRGFPKRYDFFVRRSFDGGKKWTNANGDKEDPRNLSNMKEQGNPGWSVMEPRLYATPGTIAGGQVVNDVQNHAVFYAAYSTTHNPHDPYVEGTKDQPRDLYWTMTDNFGESYVKEWNDVVGKWEYPWLAKVHDANDETSGFAGAQIRTNPQGTKLFASFQADVGGSYALTETGGGPCRGNGEGSDVCSNSTTQGDTLLARFDVTGDGRVDDDDETDIQMYLQKYDNGEVALDLKYDLNDDGDTTGQDLKLLAMGKKEFEKRSKTLARRRAYLRGRQ